MSLLSGGKGVAKRCPVSLLIFVPGSFPREGCSSFVFLSSKGGQFTEDGSFIGQYVPGKPPVSAQSTPQNPSLQGANAGMATYV